MELGEAEEKIEAELRALLETPSVRRTRGNH